MWQDIHKMAYIWILEFLKKNGDLEYSELSALTSIEFGYSQKKVKELFQTLNSAKKIKLEKRQERVYVCLLK